jgi:hypothetical protein
MRGLVGVWNNLEYGEFRIKGGFLYPKIPWIVAS